MITKPLKIKSKKIYFVDTGLRNAILNNFSSIDARKDKGNLFENFILNELLFEGFEVKYWRTTGKAEVDFVLNLDREVIPIEVKSFGIKKINKTRILFVQHWMI